MKPISLPQGCNPELAAAIARFAQEISSSHSITSRRFSVWSLVRRHVDQPFCNAIAPLKRHSWGALAGDFVPSLAWEPPSPDVLELARMFPEISSPRINGSLEQASRAESMVAAITQWDECIRLAARKVRVTKGLSQLIATLDAMRLLLAAITKLRPKVERDVYGISIRDSLTRPDQFTFCDLCWRESLRSAALKDSESRLRARYLTDRFCGYHNPRDSRSQYRVDVRYRTAFRKELDALTKLANSAYSFSFSPPNGADFQEIRKTAYDLVHARLRSLGSDEPGLREQVAELLRHGLNQSEVARRLGVSRQAVSQAKKSLEGILQARQIDAELSPRTGESLSLSGPDGDMMRSRISAMKKEGRSVREIARTLNRFGHSIRFIVEPYGS